MRILLCNDDGYQSPGLRFLSAQLKKNHDVFISAPKREMSGVSSSITIHGEIAVEEVDDQAIIVDGTPIDCAKIALANYLDKSPDLLISGINLGTNLGSDIIYSGTVAAALDAAILGVKSAALSTDHDFRDGDPSGEFIAYFDKAIDMFISTDLPPCTLLNINIPSKDIKGIKLVSMGIIRYDAAYVRRDESQSNYTLIGERDMEFNRHEEVDERYFNEGYMTVTPIHYDMTNYDFLQKLEKTLG